MEKLGGPPKPGNVYFDIQSEMGSTKHLGGVKATDEILRLCRIKKGAKILEVGCGVGLTTRYLARKYDVQITGIDISEKMIRKAKERNKNQGNTRFLVADAQKLPFKENEFDIVFCESVVAFIPDKLRAVKEFRRVVKKDGFVGINEGTWKIKPPTALEDYFSMTIGNARFRRWLGWTNLLKEAGLKNIVWELGKVNMLSEMIENIGRIDLGDYLHAWFVLVRGLFTSAGFREFAWNALKGSPAAFMVFKYWGYGLYVGQK